MTTTLPIVCVGIRTAVIAVSIAAMFAGCGTQDPAGPQTFVTTGDNSPIVNTKGGPGDNSPGGNVTTPAPVFNTPVVVTAPEPAE